MRLERAERLPQSGAPRALLDGADSLIGALEALVERSPDFRCLTVLGRAGDERAIRLVELWSRARRIERALRDGGLRRGDVAILILPTGPELVSAYFGVMLAGGVPGLVATPSNRLSEHGYYLQRVGAILANAQARTVYCDPRIAALFAGDAARHLAGASVLTPDAVADAEATSGAGDHPRGDEIATIQYSSGSTGVPKGIRLSHRAMLNNIRAVRDGLGLESSDVSVNWIPLYHDMGLIDAFLLPLLIGSPSVLIPTMDFMADPAIWLWAIHRHRGALSWAPNFAYSVCANRLGDDELEGLDLSSWRIAINAAEPVLAPTIEAFTDRFARYGFAAAAMTPAWGLAENVTIATAHPVAEPPRVETIDRGALATDDVARPTTADDGLPSVAIGQCIPQCVLEIRDPASGEPLADRGVGRVWLKSDSLFTSFHRDEARTGEVLVDGWLDTGDEGYMAGDDLFFVSRAKDLIVIGGDKYAPHDIETLINEVDGVRKGCAVAFGVLNRRRGTEEIGAVIETRESDATRLQELQRAIKRHVLEATGLTLRHVALVPPGGVEKTTSGKLARRATRARHAERFPA